MKTDKQTATGERNPARDGTQMMRERLIRICKQQDGEGNAPRKRSKAQARVTQFVNADNKLMFCVSVVNEGFVPHEDEGRVLGNYVNSKAAHLRASVYNNEGI